MRKALATCVIAGIVGLGACTGTPKKKSLTAEEMVNLDPLPLAKGAKWTYSVTVKRFDPDQDKETSKALSWTTEVIDVREANGVTAYRVKGWPSDLESTADADL